MHQSPKEIYYLEDVCYILGDRGQKWVGLRHFPENIPFFPGIHLQGSLRVSGLNHTQPDSNLACNELCLLAARAELKFGRT